MENLSEQHKLFSFILNNSFDAIACYSPVKNNIGDIVDFKFIYLNDSAFATISGKREDYIGKSFLAIFPYAAKDGMFDAFKKTAVTGVPVEDVFYYENGEYKGWYRDSIIKYGDGIIVFFRDVTSQKSLEKQLKEQTLIQQKLLSEKDILLKETYHRVKNNLQLISSLLNLQSSSIENTKYFETCITCKRRITTMAMIHQNLYEDKDFRSVNITNFVTEILNSRKTLYNDCNREIRFDTEIDNVNIDLNWSVNIGLIINELITNSIKHAFCERETGVINIQIKQYENDLHLVVSDNGAGLPEDFRIQNIKTLGLTLVRTLVEQMDGSLKIAKSPGASFAIRLPGLFGGKSSQT